MPGRYLAHTWQSLLFLRILVKRLYVDSLVPFFDCTNFCLCFVSVDCDWEFGQWPMNPDSWQTAGSFAFSGFSRLTLCVPVQGRGKFSPCVKFEL